jgi:putative aldouronate transport system substrate-binding protein
MQNLLAIGLEGRHYTVSGSNAVVTPAQAKLFADEINPLRQLKIDYFGRKALKPKQDPIREKGLFLYENNIEILVHDPTLPYVSDTMSKRGNELNKIIADANVKFVMGRIDEQGFKEAVDLWRKGGGEAAIREYADEQAKALANK